MFNCSKIKDEDFHFGYCVCSDQNKFLRVRSVLNVLKRLEMLHLLIFTGSFLLDKCLRVIFTLC